MPVMVVGADTAVGSAVLEALLGREGEIRAVVSDPQHGVALRERGVKVAIGDVSDASHVGAAALNAFSMVLVADAAFDARERSFASTPAAVFSAWAEAVRESGVRRVIWVGNADAPVAPADVQAAEVASVEVVRSAVAEAAAEVARLDDLAELT